LNVHLFATSESTDLSTLENKVQELIVSKHEQLKKIDELYGQVAFAKKQIDDKNTLLNSSNSNLKRVQHGMGKLHALNQPDLKKE